MSFVLRHKACRKESLVPRRGVSRIPMPVDHSHYGTAALGKRVKELFCNYSIEVFIWVIAEGSPKHARWRADSPLWRPFDALGSHVVPCCVFLAVVLKRTQKPVLSFRAEFYGIYPYVLRVRHPQSD